MFAQATLVVSSLGSRRGVCGGHLEELLAMLVLVMVVSGGSFSAVLGQAGAGERCFCLRLLDHALTILLVDSSQWWCCLITNVDVKKRFLRRFSLIESLNIFPFALVFTLIYCADLYRFDFLLF